MSRVTIALLIGTAVLASALPAASAPAAPSGRVWLGADERPLPFTSAEQIQDFLATATVVTVKDLSTGITKPQKLLLERDGVRAHAVFHSIDRRERKVKRLPNGQLVLHLLDSYKNQAAAYELSRLLGLDSVPPTAVREVEGRLGSVQPWIENAMTEQKRRDRGLEAPDPTIWNQQKAEQGVFDNLINNIDRNTGNSLIDGSWNLWLIDHSRTFGMDRKLPYPERIRSLSKEFWAGLNDLDPIEVEERLSPYLGKKEIRALMIRRDLLIESLEARIARLGEDRIVYEPGRPWAVVQVSDEPSAS